MFIYVVHALCFYAKQCRLVTHTLFFHGNEHFGEFCRHTIVSNQHQMTRESFIVMKSKVLLRMYGYLGERKIYFVCLSRVLSICFEDIPKNVNISIEFYSSWLEIHLDFGHPLNAHFRRPASLGHVIDVTSDVRHMHDIVSSTLPY